MVKPIPACSSSGFVVYSGLIARDISSIPTPKSCTIISIVSSSKLFVIISIITFLLSSKSLYPCSIAFVTASDSAVFISTISSKVIFKFDINDAIASLIVETFISFASISIFILFSILAAPQRYISSQR